MSERCDKCHREIHIGEHPFCPHGFSTQVVIDDTLKGGGRMIENLGHDPVFIESKSQLRLEMAKRGLTQRIKHVGVPGTDRSPHTTRWT